MDELGIAVSIAPSVWILFFGGADKIENTLAGYLQFGLAGEKAWAIRLLAWFTLAATAVFLLTKLAP